MNSRIVYAAVAATSDLTVAAGLYAAIANHWPKVWFELGALGLLMLAAVAIWALIQSFTPGGER